jgi:Zn-finger nucleic acid-binding protein
MTAKCPYCKYESVNQVNEINQCPECGETWTSKQQAIIDRMDKALKEIEDHEHCRVPSCKEYQLNGTIHCDADLLAIGHRCCAAIAKKARKVN